MEQKIKSLLKTLKINEGLISTLMGGVVVVIMATMIFNYFKSINRNGKITEESASNAAQIEESTSKELPAIYKVKKGDDLWHISEKFYNSGYNYVDIIKENRLANGGMIYEGNELKIPKVEPRLTAKMKAELAAKEKAGREVKEVKTVVKTAKVSIEGAKYTTVKGDHLWSIAVRAYGDGYGWTKIYNANKKLIGRNPSLLYSGVELSLPR